MPGPVTGGNTELRGPKGLKIGPQEAHAGVFWGLLGPFWGLFSSLALKSILKIFLKYQDKVICFNKADIALHYEFGNTKNKRNNEVIY